MTIATTAAELTTVRGKPHAGQLFLFVAGGLTAFAVLEGLLRALRSADEQAPETAFPFTGALNFLSVSAGLGAAIGLAHAIHSTLAWMAAPLAATALYMLVVAVQIIIEQALRA
ncbi:MAG: hypothetical protein M3295_03730 [Chloroflexota bacterium]|nr:hypothetical protein [Chloroflexota bacterium]